MRTHDRIALMSRRAEELARSGKFRDWRAIEQQLRSREKFSEAPQWFSDSFRRETFDRICAEARANLP
jgi:hypothetical protein